MKRIALLLFAVLALSLTACDVFNSTFDLEFSETSTEANASAEIATARYVGMVQTFHIDDVTGYPQIGDPDAPIEILQFSSFSCPHCSRFHIDIFPSILQRIRNGEVSYVFIPLYIAGNIGDGEAAAEAMMCAGYQESAFSFTDLLFDAQVEYGNEAFTSSRLGAMAQSLGLDLEAWQTCLDNDGTSLYELSPSQLAQEFGITGTPSLVVRDDRGEQIVLVSPAINEIDNAIDGIGIDG